MEIKNVVNNIIGKMGDNPQDTKDTTQTTGNVDVGNRLDGGGNVPLDTSTTSDTSTQDVAKPSEEGQEVEGEGKEVPLPEDLSKLLEDLGIPKNDEEILKYLSPQQQEQIIAQQTIPQTTQTTNTTEDMTDEELKRYILEEKRQKEIQAKIQENITRYSMANPKFMQMLQNQELVTKATTMFGNAIDLTQPTAPHLLFNAMLGMQVQDLVKVAFQKGMQYALASGGGVRAGGGVVGNRGVSPTANRGESGTGKEEENPFAFPKGMNPSEWV